MGKQSKGRRPNRGNRSKSSYDTSSIDQEQLVADANAMKRLLELMEVNPLATLKDVYNLQEEWLMNNKNTDIARDINNAMNNATDVPASPYDVVNTNSNSIGDNTDTSRTRSVSIDAESRECVNNSSSNTTPTVRHRVIASIEEHDITDGGNKGLPLRGGGKNDLMKDYDELSSSNESDDKGLGVGDNVDVSVRSLGYEEITRPDNEETAEFEDDDDNEDGNQQKRGFAALKCAFPKPELKKLRQIGTATKERVKYSAGKLDRKLRPERAIDRDMTNEIFEHAVNVEAEEYIFSDTAIDAQDELLTSKLMDCDLSAEEEEDHSSKDDNTKLGGDKLAREVSEVFDDMGYNNRNLVGAAIKLVMASEEDMAVFRAFLRKYFAEVVKRYLTIKREKSSGSPVRTYGDAEALEKKLNEERVVLFSKMAEFIKNSKRINLSQEYSRLTKLLIHLAYSPDGTPQTNYHSMHDNQCCIRGMTQSLPRAVYHTHHAPEKSEDIYTHLMKCVDLACTTAVKSDKLGDLYDQYGEDANTLELAGLEEYFIINALVNINHHSLAMVANEELYTLVCSASTANKLYGLGKDRYLIGDGRIRHGLHPQALNMGTGKGPHGAPLFLLP